MFWYNRNLYDQIITKHITFVCSLDPVAYTKGLNVYYLVDFVLFCFVLFWLCVGVGVCVCVL